MITLKRFRENPVLSPHQENSWEAEAAFNGCPALDNKTVRLLYRAMSAPMIHEGINMSVSTIGLASSEDGATFKDRIQFIKPENDWEKFGCEDARVTKLDDKYYIFYTALSNYPFNADGIKVGLAITRDFKTIEAKHQVTPFNAKAMSLFPAKISGKITAILTANTDLPPSKISIAFFDNEEQIWSKEYWEDFYKNLDSHALVLQRCANDHVEVGAPPILTKNGWLLVYSYIKNYFSGSAVFGIEAVLLDLKDPQKIIGRTQGAMLTPEMPYEKEGKVANIVFPSGAYIKGDRLIVSYGGADTVSCMASCDLNKLLAEMKNSEILNIKMEKYERNPILKPAPENAWEAKAVFNPAALYAGNKVHIIYRAMSDENISSLGYATSANGYDIEYKSPNPIYLPGAEFEKMGCEDPRLTQMGNTIYMCYTAFDGVNPPRVALTSISLKNFLSQIWHWTKPVLLSPPNVDDKDAAIFPGKFKDKYAILHRLSVNIDLDFVKSLSFKGKKWLDGSVLLAPRDGMWDSEKVGIAGTPIKTRKGWLLLYHGVSKYDHQYRVGAALLDLNNPKKILARTDKPILEPELPYETDGQTKNVVFPCGAVIVDDKLFIYYGGADTVIGVATLEMSKIFGAQLKKSSAQKGTRSIRSSIKKTLARGDKLLSGGSLKHSPPKPLKHHIKRILNYKIF